jgi:hypothetical protein
LNDASHNKPTVAKRDAFVRAACEAASLPLIEVKNQTSYVVKDVRLMIGEILNVNHAVTHETVVASIPLAEKPIDVVKISSSRLEKNTGVRPMSFYRSFQSYSA